MGNISITSLSASSVTVGTSLTFNGSSMASTDIANFVLNGAVAATATCSSGTASSCMVTVPESLWANTGYSVYLTQNSQGAGQSNSMSLTVTWPSNYTIELATPNSVAPGGTLTLEGTYIPDNPYAHFVKTEGVIPPTACTAVSGVECTVAIGSNWEPGQYSVYLTTGMNSGHTSNTVTFQVT